jgi:hypothetical protein
VIRVAFRHLRDTDNIGDRWCSPYDHLVWSGIPGIRVEADDLRKPGADYDIGIFGGGKIMRELAKSPAVRSGGGRVNIAWGLSTVQRNPLSIAYFRARRRLDLIGSRDWDGVGGAGGCDWVPCASSEHRFFDAPPTPTHSTVFYGHFSKSAKMGVVIPEALPTRTNHGASLEEALQFIASGETVVSNSYHGVFWALLMGRRVLCLPFSNKFSMFRLPPGYSTATSWSRDLAMAQAQPELLSICRDATARFRQKVLDIIALSRAAQDVGRIP